MELGQQGTPFLLASRRFEIKRFGEWFLVTPHAVTFSAHCGNIRRTTKRLEWRGNRQLHYIFFTRFPGILFDFASEKYPFPISALLFSF
jgi:hypothetical protein